MMCVKEKMKSLNMLCAKKLCDSHMKVRNALYCWIDILEIETIVDQL